MTDILLSQSDGDRLLAMEKYSRISWAIELPIIGEAIELKFSCADDREEFVLNYARGGRSINLSKRNHHFRCIKGIALARLDLDGPPHRNPDGQATGTRHLHLYREGFGLKWAFDIPDGVFQNLDDAYETLFDFMKYCNVVQMPQINKGLFS